MCEFKKVDDVMLKVITGVGTAVLIAVLFFGLEVYAFMETGDRFTSEDGAAQLEYVEERYVQKDVYKADQKHTKEQLDRIEAKLDRLLREK